MQRSGSSRLRPPSDESSDASGAGRRRPRSREDTTPELDRDCARQRVDSTRSPTHNPVLVEAQRLARQRLGETRRRGEGPPQRAAPPPLEGPEPPPLSRWAVEDDQAAPGRPRHSPIVWKSSGSLAAAIAQAEVERFKEHQRAEMPRSESAVSEFVFDPSAPPSSPEEEAHIAREGSVAALAAPVSDSEGEELPTAAGNSRGGGAAHPPTPPLPQLPVRPDSYGECRSVELYEKLNRISEGTYGVVYRARSTETGAICALKKVKLDRERDGFPLTAIREINVLLSLRHPNIVDVSEVVVGPSLDSVFMVMEFGDHDLASVMRQRMRQPFSVAEVKTLLRSLLAGVAYLHDNWILHRDLKTSNILYTNTGDLKICDFGLARQYGSPLKPYTQMVVTLWYRAPELLLGAKTYSTAVDVWSVGCIMGELLTREPLLAGKGEIDQLGKIFELLGTPDEQSWPGLDALPNFRKFNFRQARRSSLRQRFPPPGPIFDGRPTLSEAGFDLLQRLLALCPERRISAAEALRHPWFQEQPLAVDTALMPTFPSTAVPEGRRR